jgi:hypothetical protein
MLAGMRRAHAVAHCSRGVSTTSMSRCSPSRHLNCSTLAR